MGKGERERKRERERKKRGQTWGVVGVVGLLG